MTASKTTRGLIGYVFPDGCPVCVDCDVFPPGAADVREGDKRAEILICSMCSRPLSEVDPLAGKVNPS